MTVQVDMYRRNSQASVDGIHCIGPHKAISAWADVMEQYGFKLMVPTITTPRILSQRYHKGYVLTDFMTRFNTHTYFVSMETALGNYVIAQTDDRDEAEQRFEDLCGA